MARASNTYHQKILNNPKIRFFTYFIDIYSNVINSITSMDYLLSERAPSSSILHILQIVRMYVSWELWGVCARREFICGCTFEMAKSLWWWVVQNKTHSKETFNEYNLMKTVNDTLWYLCDDNDNESYTHCARVRQLQNNLSAYIKK